MIATKSHVPALAGAALLTFAWIGGAAAAPAVQTTKVADATQAVTGTSSLENEDDNASCTRSRKRLWVDGEGWIVRRVTTCR
jgi:P pilus assembly chaperone PapD